MSNHLGDTNKTISETPRTDSAEKHAYEFKDEYTPVCESKLVRQLERELNAANQIAKKYEDRYFAALARIKRLDQSAQEIDKEWFQVIESILGFHPVSMTEALRIGIERIKKQNQRIKRLEEAGDRMRLYCADLDDCFAWDKVKEVKP